MYTYPDMVVACLVIDDPWSPWTCQSSLDTCIHQLYNVGITNWLERTSEYLFLGRVTVCPTFRIQVLKARMNCYSSTMNYSFSIPKILLISAKVWFVRISLLLGNLCIQLQLVGVSDLVVLFAIAWLVSSPLSSFCSLGFVLDWIAGRMRFVRKLLEQNRIAILHATCRHRQNGSVQGPELSWQSKRILRNSDCSLSRADFHIAPQMVWGVFGLCPEFHQRLVGAMHVVHYVNSLEQNIPVRLLFSLIPWTISSCCRNRL